MALGDRGASKIALLCIAVALCVLAVCIIGIAARGNGTISIKSVRTHGGTRITAKRKDGLMIDVFVDDPDEQDGGMGTDRQGR